ncbi:hypothetical protein D3C81_1358230 [compost metagenome]
MRPRVGQREGRAPGTAIDQPTLDAEVLAHLLDVGHQMLRGVVAQLAEGRGAAAAALIDQHDAVAPGVEEAAVGGRDASAWAAMQVHHRNAIGRAALLDMQGVQCIHGQRVFAVRGNRRVQRAHGGASQAGSTRIAGHIDQRHPPQVQVFFAFKG